MDDCFGTCINPVHSLIMMAGNTVKYPIWLDFNESSKLQLKILESEAQGRHVPFHSVVIMLFLGRNQPLGLGLSDFEKIKNI